MEELYRVPLTQQIRDYLARYGTSTDEVLAEVAERTAELGKFAIMQIPPEYGAMLTLLTRLVNARRAIEIGTFTGYSSICIARDAGQEGRPMTACPLGADFHADPHAVLRELREAGPVHRVVLPDGAERWLVTRYHDVRAALIDSRLSSELDRGVANAAPGDVLVRVRSAEVFRTTVLNRDGATHDRLRRLVVRAFSASRVDKLHQRLVEIAEELLDGLHGTVDLIDHYAFPIPSILTCEMLGVPLADRPHFRGLIEDMLAKPAAGAMAALQGLMDYIRGQLKVKRAEPADDLLSDLIEMHEAGDRMDDDELVAMGFTLLFGGVGSTVHLIGNAIAELLTHPEQRALAAADPSRLEAVVDEVLRHEPPHDTGRGVTTAFAGLRRVPPECGDLAHIRVTSAQETSTVVGPMW